MKYLLVICLLTQTELFAPLALGSQKLRLQLQRQTTKVQALRQQVVALEEKLALQNLQYIEGVKKSAQIRSALQRIDSRLQTIENDMAVEKERIAVMSKKYMVRSIDGDTSSDDLYLNQVMVRGLLAKKQHYKKLKKNLLQSKLEADLLTKRLNKYWENERTAYSLISELENSKGRVTKDFLDHKHVLRSLESRVAKGDALELIKREADNVGQADEVMWKMQGPLYSFRSMKRDKGRKGVLYRFDQQLPCYASYPGRIQYLGRLANYGNLVIINHGQEIRSVLLGDIHPKVKQGQQVAGGEIIGYTKIYANSSGQLYFEVRVRGLARNTLNWIDHDSLVGKEHNDRKRKI